MPIGYIKSINAGKKYGYICDSSDGTSLKFTFDQFNKEDRNNIQEGSSVEYEFTIENGRKIIKSIKIFENDGFLNPYNFVQFIKYPEDINGENVMYKTFSIPSDAIYRNALSGTIGCTIKTDKEHPLFIGQHESDGRVVFYNIDGKYCIPASTIKGCIRTVFEAATNSCMDVNNEKLTRRMDTKKENFEKIPARLEKGKNGWNLRFLHNARIGFYKNGIRAKGIAVNKLENEKEYYGIVNKKPSDASYKFNLSSVIKISDEQTYDDGEYRGWLYVTNENTPRKKMEQFFFENPRTKKVLENIDKNIIQSFSDLMKDYKKLHQKEWKEAENSDINPEKPYGNKRVALSSFVNPKYEDSPHDGQLVYALARKTDKNITKDDIVGFIPVPLSRYRYKYTLKDLFDKHFLKEQQKCDDADKICPACRVFGRVDGQNAQAGKLIISNAYIKDAKTPDTETITLQILASPKPTTGLFYLNNEDTKKLKDQYDSDQNIPRGRKFYRHFHALKKEEYSLNERNRMNVTAEGVIFDDLEFTFDIQFKNLRPEELGALLWSIQLEDKVFHRIGMAKPLGFGSVKMSVNELKILDAAKRYRSLSDDGYDIKDISYISKLIDRYKASMCKLYGKADFKALDNIGDLLWLLGDNFKGMNIHYPRKQKEKTKEDENFKWFMEFKKLDKAKLPETQKEKSEFLKYEYK